jgi:hypothetical protein
MASNDNNGNRGLEEEVETSAVRKRLRLSDNDGGDDNSSDLQHEDTVEEDEEMEEEVSSEVSSMNQIDTSEDKLVAKHDSRLFFGDDGDTTSPSSEPHTPEMPSSCVRLDPDGSDDDGSDDDDFWI